MLPRCEGGRVSGESLWIESPQMFHVKHPRRSIADVSRRMQHNSGDE